MKREKWLSRDEWQEINQLEIERKDERNIALGNAAKARAYELMIVLYAISILLLSISDMISFVAFIIMFGIFAISQIYFVIRLRNYHKEF